MPKSTRFKEIVQRILDLHEKKMADYGTDEDPYANVRASERLGIPAWQGVLVRMGDKMQRLQQFAKKGELRNESFEDSALDLAVYAIILYDLYTEKPIGSSNETGGTSHTECECCVETCSC